METTRVIVMSKDYLINFTVSPLHLVLWLSESVVLLSFSDWLCHHCGDPALLLPSFLLLDVSWGSPAVPHACRSLWERILAEKVLLRVWLPLPCHRCRRLSSYWLQELRDQESVSAASFFLSLSENILGNAEQTCWMLHCVGLPAVAVCGRFWKEIRSSFLPAPYVHPWRLHQNIWAPFARDGQLFNFLCHLKVADRLNTVVSGEAAATLMPFCSKTLLWPLVCKCCLKEESAVQGKKAFYID